MIKSHVMLKFTCMLFALNVCYAFECTDLLYHTAFLTLTCTSVATHWCESKSHMKRVDRVIAHMCYGLCCHTHLVQHPNTEGTICLVAVLGLWVCEHFTVHWKVLHVALHAVSCVGTHLAIDRRWHYI